jgi:hypothetical protein
MKSGDNLMVTVGPYLCEEYFSFYCLHGRFLGSLIEACRLHGVMKKYINAFSYFISYVHVTDPLKQ